MYTVCIDTHHSLKAVSRFPPQGTCHQGCLPSGHKRLSPPLWHGRLCNCFQGLEEPCELPSGRRCAQRSLQDFNNSKIYEYPTKLWHDQSSLEWTCRLQAFTKPS